MPPLSRRAWGPWGNTFNNDRVYFVVFHLTIIATETFFVKFRSNEFHSTVQADFFNPVQGEVTLCTSFTFITAKISIVLCRLTTDET
jgi:hypothetical protein